MILAKRNNYYPAFNTLFDDFWGSDVSDWSTYKPNRSKVAVNVSEDENSFNIEVAAPGFDKENFAVKVENEVLTISSKRDEKNEEGKTKEYSRREFSYESFERSFSLPKGLIAEEKIEANYKDGILYVSVPKAEAAKPKPVRKIEIN